MRIIDCEIEGLKLVESELIFDSRGSFSRNYCERELSQYIENRRVVQINQSKTITAGAVRGLHYQKSPNIEMKMVRCIKGRVWDVAVDLRRDSKTFLKWHAEELTPENARMMLIPEGFAHGFQAIEPASELLYLHTAFYDKESEDGIRYDDCNISIEWPLPVTEISIRDKNHKEIDIKNFNGIKL